jgi:pimeloyl-ACP methyl ester carboxylesterase
MSEQDRQIETIIRCGRDPALFGVLTPASGGIDPALPVILFLNSGLVRRIGTRRISVKLARALGEAGFLCVRFDFAGIGDSAPRVAAGSFMDGACADVRTMMDHLEERYGVSSFVTVGLCSGADVGLAAARLDPRIRGVVQINPHIHKNLRYYLHQVVRPDWWRQVIAKRLPSLARGPGDPGEGKRPTWGPPPTHAESLSGLEDIARHDVSLLVVFTAGTIAYDGQFRDVYKSANFNDDFLCIRRMPSTHVASPMHDQAYVRQRIFDWVTAVWTPSAASRGR